MGRREDGAAVRESRRYGHELTGSMTGGNPRRRLMRRRGPEANVASGTRAMAGLRSRAIGPGARSWLTGVAGPRSRKRGPRIAERRKWSAGRRVPPIATRNGTLARRPTGRVSQTAHRGPRKPQRLPALRSPRWETGIAIRNEGLPGADTKNTGDDARLLVIPGRAPKARSRASSRNTREPGIHTPQHQKGNERRAKYFDCGVWIPGSLANASVPE
jgi:hypothetical protein